MAARGADPVLSVGFAQAPALEKVAKEHPKSRFAIIDAVVDLPNVRSIVFKEHEGSFLLGVLAPLASKPGQVGFVRDMAIPPIRPFPCSNVLPLKHAPPTAPSLPPFTAP